MILISIKSEIMDCKRQFEKDLDAEKYLKRVKRIHDLGRLCLHREIHPDYIEFRETASRRHGCLARRRLRKRVYITALSKAIPLRVEIINTNANQLNMQLK